jgi:putative flippase GtrA
VKSAAVGGVATLTDLGVLSLLVYALGLSPRLASPVSLALGIALQFVGNKLFAFEDRRRAWGRQAALFLSVEALGFAANVALFDLALRASPLPLLVTRMLCQSVVYFGLCLPGWSLIFKAGAAHDDEGVRA